LKSQANENGIEREKEEPPNVEFIVILASKDR
jgi:hypothetical protein